MGQEYYLFYNFEYDLFGDSIVIPWLDTHSSFPDTRLALTDASGAAGLLAAGADLSAQRILDAYRQGIFPWFGEGQPILWWSPDPRMVLPTAEFVVSHSLRKRLKKIARSQRAGGPWQVKFDSAFEAVMGSCAAPRRGADGTWISEEMIASYTELHRMGYAHSSELWFEGKLVAGLYGLCIGRMFYGESMFTTVRDGSKIAFAWLVGFLQGEQVALIDCQQETSHLASLGARAISRDDFIVRMTLETVKEPIECWRAPRACRLVDALPSSHCDGEQP